MYLRKVRVKGKTYWSLVETYRTERGPRQRIVSYLGDAGSRTCKGVKAAAEDQPRLTQCVLFDDDLSSDWQEIDTRRVETERPRGFGDWWVGLWLLNKLGLTDKLEDLMPTGREDVPWWATTITSILCRMCEPSSELRIAETLYERSALPDLLGIPVDKINDDRLYRTLDHLLPHKAAIEQHLVERMGSLFGIKYDLLLYDVTSTFFEGACSSNPSARRGYSRDQRPDCKQVNIALVVSRCGMPLAVEVFPGNTHDSKTVNKIVTTVEERYGKADRVWVMDRGMVSEDNVTFLKEGGRRYILGTPKSGLKQFEKQLAEGNWIAVRDSVEVKLCPAPGGEEMFILCRSADRAKKELAMHTRFAEKMEAGLKKIAGSCAEKKRNPVLVGQQIGRLKQQNSRAAALFHTDVITAEDGSASSTWSKRTEWEDWARLSEGCYLLRSNITDWTADELWEAYIQLTQAEAAFRIQKSDLALRPVWHQLEKRVEAHIFICFLAFVLWKTLGQICSAAGLGDEPRVVLDELKEIRLVDVVMKTKNGATIRRRCITQPSREQAILLKHLGIRLPKQLKVTGNVV